MNIHVDKETFTKLLGSTIVTIEMGSYMYEVKNSESDSDYLCIYVPSFEEEKSFSFSHHQLQYKDLENKIDYVFTTLPNFLRNCLNGDSTINFEVLHSSQLIGTPIDFLFYYRHSFYNYSIIKSYLGMARRDLKHINKEASEYDKNKRLFHAIRGFRFAKQIYETNELELVCKGSFYRDIRLFEGDLVRKSYIDEYSEKIEEYRKYINTEYDAGKIKKYMSVEDQKLIDQELYRLYNSSLYTSNRMSSFDMDIIYKANEHGVTY